MGNQPRVLVVPYPSQGHINPMLRFSVRLALRGQPVTVVMTEAILQRISHVGNSWLSPPAIQFDTISDGLAPDFDRQRNVDQFLAHLRKTGSSSLSHLIRNLNAAGTPVSCIVYDSFLPWIMDVANSFNIPSAFFWTQSVAVYLIYYHFINGLIEEHKNMDSIAIPGLPRLVMEEMPSFLRPADSHRSILQLVEEQFRNIWKATWVLGNSFYELESEALEWLPSGIPPIRTVGPLIPSALLEGGEPQDIDFGANLWKAEDCIDWLNTQATSSVVYVSFGSIAVLCREQIHEIALGLQGSGHAFLWVIRPARDGDIAADSLPENFIEANIKQGRVIPWCSQPQVLSHPAVGMLLGHCGWNSTLESLSFGVPLLAIPQWSDQNTNLKYVAEEWKTGLQLNKRADGVVGREEVETSIRKIMEGEEGIQLRKNVLKWKALAKEALSEGGSSDRNIDQFVREIGAKAALLSSGNFSNMTSTHDQHT